MKRGSNLLRIDIPKCKVGNIPINPVYYKERVSKVLSDSIKIYFSNGRWTIKEDVGRVNQPSEYPVTSSTRPSTLSIITH